MLGLIMLNVTYKPYTLNVVMLNVVILSLVAPLQDRLEQISTGGTFLALTANIRLVWKSLAVIDALAYSKAI
jgi:hypothetical protein